MINRMMLWVRRNSRRAVALALAPGLATLGFDAFIEHYAGRSGENPLQAVPVWYGGVAFLLLSFVCVLRPRAAFTWGARIIGAAGVVVGGWGAVLHAQLFLADLDGKWTRNTIEGALDMAPPMLAPLAFALLGGALIALTSPRLSLRIKVGRPADARPSAPVLPMPLPAPAAQSGSDRNVGQG